MFLCRDCTHPKDKWLHDLPMGISYGPCENCHYSDHCIDGWSIDPNWKKNLEETLAKLRAKGRDI